MKAGRVKKDFHFEDDEVLSAVKKSGYAKKLIAHHLRSMTADQKWSLYRGVISLALADLQFVDPVFIRKMNELGKYAFEKHGPNSFPAHLQADDRCRSSERLLSGVLTLHAYEHFKAYGQGEKHDHFDTLGHQLAAAAYNAMMEFFHADLGNEI